MRSRHARWLIFAVCAAVPTRGGPSWTASCIAGPPDLPRGRCRIEIGAGRIAIRGRAEGSFVLAPDTISDIVYSPARFRRSRAIDLNPAGYGPGPGEGIALLWLTAGVTALVLHPMKGTDHFVTIAWQDRGTEQELTLQMGKGDHTAILEELRRVTGKQWQDVNAETRRVLSMLEADSAASVEVRFDRETIAGDAVLPPGTYRMVFVPRSPDDGFLCFFSGPIAARNIAWITPAVRTTGGSAGAEAGVQYASPSGTSCVTAIRTQTQMFQLRGCGQGKR